MKLRSIAIALSALATFTLGATAGCKPAVRGLCNSTKDCRPGSYCATSGICLARSGTCAPACGEGEICSGSVCAVLKPVVSVKAPSGPISPAFPQITVHVDAAVGIALHGIALEVDNSLKAVANGSLAAPLAGDNLVTLSQFEFNAEGSVSVRATLRFQLPGAAAEESVSSVAVPAVIDTVPPTVTVFFPIAADAVNGWVPRTAGTLEVRATVDDGSGTGAQSATLSFDTCPASAACSYSGTALSQGGGATVFSFAVPRDVQAAGSEAPLAVTVKAQDLAGNKAQGAGIVQIDDAPPQIGAVGFVSTAGVTGEDGKTWFVGGAGAPDVEISVPVADSGAGLSSLTLHLTDSDVAGPDPVPIPQAGGTVHFMLPASRVVGREGALHFTLAAADLVHNKVTTPPGNIWVDDVPPAVTLAKVDYSSALPAKVCATGLSNSNCGRRGGTHLLRDDVATVSFDVTDCGSGVAAASQLSLSTISGGVSKSAPVVANGVSAPSCSNGNGVHHYAVSLNLGDQAPALDVASQNGTVIVHLVANGFDRVAHVVHATAPPAATNGDGLALVSLWRWRRPMSSNPVGSPALLSGSAGARTVVVATDATGTGNANLFALGADGSLAYSAAVSPGIGAEIAVDSQDAVYAVFANGTSSTLNIIREPLTGTPAAPDNPACTASNTGFVNPPAIATISGKDVAVVASGYHSLTGNNLFLFQDQSGACGQFVPSLLVPNINGDFAGVTLAPGMAFLAEARGFSSVNQNSSGFDTNSVVTYSPSLPSSAPPSLAGGSAIFGSLSPDQSVRRTTEVCPTAACTSWQTAAGFTAAAASSNLSFTPVFDATNIWTVDDKGLVYAWSKDKGTLAAGFPVTLTSKAAPPVLLQAGALLVQQDGGVTLISPQGAPLALWNVGSFGNSPVAPAIDTLAVGGIAYVATSSWVYALHVPSAPLLASSGIWPRPGRDSCNSRNAASACQ